MHSHKLEESWLLFFVNGMCCCNPALPTELKRIRRSSAALRGKSRKPQLYANVLWYNASDNQAEPLALVLIVREMGARSCLPHSDHSRCGYRMAKPICLSRLGIIVLRQFQQCVHLERSVFITCPAKRTHSNTCMAWLIVIALYPYGQ